MIYCNFPKLLQPFYCENIVRVGKDHDGGYLVNRLDVLKSTKLLSFGIGNDSSFETDFLALANCPLEAYDDAETTLDLFAGQHTFHAEMITKDNIGKILGAESGGLFLKCDIEGGEYEILDELIRNSRKLSGLVMEFHSLHLPQYANDLVDFVSKIGLRLIHIHANNYAYQQGPNFIMPTVVEVTFSSSDNLELRRDIASPHPLDQPNNPDEPLFAFKFI